MKSLEEKTTNRRSNLTLHPSPPGVTPRDYNKPAGLGPAGGAGHHFGRVNDGGGGGSAGGLTYPGPYCTFCFVSPFSPWPPLRRERSAGVVPLSGRPSGFFVLLLSPFSLFFFFPFALLWGVRTLGNLVLPSFTMRPRRIVALLLAPRTKQHTLFSPCFCSPFLSFFVFFFLFFVQANPSFFFSYPFCCFSAAIFSFWIPFLDRRPEPLKRLIGGPSVAPLMDSRRAWLDFGVGPPPSRYPPVMIVGLSTVTHT